MNKRSKHSETRPRKPSSSRINEGTRDLIWDIFAISSHIAEVRRVWATMLGVSGPQWLILTAVDYLDEGEGVSVGTVSAKLHVNQTFVVAQSKTLEAKGYLTRRSSDKDARVVLMSLTDQTRLKLRVVAPRQWEVNDFIFSQINKATMKTVSETMSLIRTNLERAVILLGKRQA